MKFKSLLLLPALCLLLSGCSLLDGSYVSVTPHREQRQTQPLDAATASNYQELIGVLEQIVSSGQESAAIQVPDYPADSVKNGVNAAVNYVMNGYPVGAYAVEDIQCELGTSGSVPAVAVVIQYRRTPSELRRIRTLDNMEEAQNQVAQALKNCDTGIVLLVENYAAQDMAQFVQDYAAENPQTVMELPQVTETVYGGGSSRVVELVFSYQNSRDDLRKMQNQVAPVFNSAVLYVSGDGAEQQKFSQLYAFLMERFDYKIETSLTPAYSLLRHGVGDSRAFATVYAAMCRGAGLECLTVTGTCSGEPRTWNIIREGERHYHVDLLWCSELGGYRAFTDAEMTGYVWDYSAYPACGGAAPGEAASMEAEETESAELREEIS